MVWQVFVLQTEQLEGLQESEQFQKAIGLKKVFLET